MNDLSEFDKIVDEMDKDADEGIERLIDSSDSASMPALKFYRTIKQIVKNYRDEKLKENDNV